MLVREARWLLDRKQHVDTANEACDLKANSTALSDNPPQQCKPNTKSICAGSTAASSLDRSQSKNFILAVEWSCASFLPADSDVGLISITVTKTELP
mmetsp:Transcript_35681/g.106490  ORF Transcript_35681/g.106490 Transcript_35681/m.106490 type:complete len:97 (-) Transcript_35681:1263-1553(-)